MAKTKLENSEFVLKCVLNHLEIKYRDLEKHNKSAYDEGVIAGLKSAYYFITGKDLSDDEIKELADSKSN